MSRSPLLALALAAAVPLAACGAADKPAHPNTASPRMTSSIADGATLNDPVRWEARLAGVSAVHVASVRFLIDGKVRHLERLAPYLFAGRGNMLLPGSLRPGSHTFAVDALLVDGRRVTTASTALVSPAAYRVPRAVVGRWTRTVRPAEVRRTASFRDPASGDALPVGSWKLRIGTDGVARYIDPTSAHDETVGQVRFEPGGRLVVGNEIPNFPGASDGGFCPDTVGTGRYRWSIDGAVLVVRVVGDRQCADRNSFWNGTFTR
jgi:hypothetical protein